MRGEKMVGLEVCVCGGGGCAGVSVCGGVFICVYVCVCTVWSVCGICVYVL